MKKLLKYLKPYWYIAICSPICMILEVLVDLSLPTIMSTIVNDSLYASSIEEGLAVVAKSGVVMICLVILGGLTGLGAAGFASAASQSFGNDLRRDAFAHVMSLSPEQTDRFTVGSLVTRLTNDITMMQSFVAMALRMFFRSPIMFVGGIVMAIALNPKFGLIILVSLPIQLLVVYLVMRKVRPMFDDVQVKLDNVNAVVQENVTGARVVKAYVREDHEFERFKNANGELRDTNMKVHKMMAIMHPVLTVVMNAAIIAVILIGGLDIANVAGSEMSAGTIMAAVTYVTQVIMSIMMVTMLFTSVSRAMASVKRVNEVLDADPVIISGDKVGEADDIAVSFRNVSFRYPSATGRPVLHDINIDIKKGETFAIIGATGSGKTSLVNMILRFYDATEGEVLVNGIPVKEYDLATLRSNISYVMQKSELFSGTIAENIRWGKPDASDEEVRAAARIAQAEDFVNGFSEGFNDYIAEKGASLSGGQKQRMSIARAIVRRPEMIILDDATSALDLATEARLRKALREELSGSTVIMIAQRIASVKEADRIAVIENGTIKDCGSHDELMRTSETYRDIYNSQVKGADEKEVAVNE
jgi:ATP-binding cassette subfamily B protein